MKVKSLFLLGLTAIVGATLFLVTPGQVSADSKANIPTSYTSEVVNISITGDNNRAFTIPLYVLKTPPSNIGLKSLVSNRKCGNLFTKGKTSELAINGVYWEY